MISSYTDLDTVSQKSVTEYIEFYYNVKRRHSANGQRSPLAHEMMNAA